jgi:predicted secreted protein
MSVISGIVTYVIIWWVVLFAVLPWGVSTALSSSLSGHAKSAPEKPRLLLKFFVTSVITLIIWGSFWGFHIPEKIHHCFLSATIE